MCKHQYRTALGPDGTHLMEFFRILKVTVVQLSLNMWGLHNGSPELRSYCNIVVLMLRQILYKNFCKSLLLLLLWRTDVSVFKQLLTRIDRTCNCMISVSLAAWQYILVLISSSNNYVWLIRVCLFFFSLGVCFFQRVDNAGGNLCTGGEKSQLAVNQMIKSTCCFSILVPRWVESGGPGQRPAGEPTGAGWWPTNNLFRSVAWFCCWDTVWSSLTVLRFARSPVNLHSLHLLSYYSLWA